MNTIQTANPISERSTNNLQKLNAEIYRILNDQHFTTEALANRLLRYPTRLVLMLGKKSDFSMIGYYLAMALSWSFALANRLHFSLEERMWIQYDLTFQPETSRELQKMLARDFTSNTLEESVLSFAGNTGELIEAIENFKTTHELNHYAETQAKLAKVLCCIYGLATHVKLDLASEFEANFKNGCPKCSHSPCSCWFHVTKLV